MVLIETGRYEHGIGGVETNTINAYGECNICTYEYVIVVVPENKAIFSVVYEK